MKDNVFGDLQFNVGWYKKEDITLWGKRYNFKIRVSATKDELPTLKQKEAYLTFKEKINEVSEKSLTPVNNFLQENMDEITDEYGQSLPSKLTDVLTPNQVLFLKSGKIAVIFDVAWTDENVVILIGQTIKVDYGYCIEGEV